MGSPWQSCQPACQGWGRLPWESHGNSARDPLEPFAMGLPWQIRHDRAMGRGRFAMGVGRLPWDSHGKLVGAQLGSFAIGFPWHSYFA